MYKACIFDLDGTLTDTLDSLTYSTNETMKEMNLPADYKRTVQDVRRKRSKSSDSEGSGSCRGSGRRRLSRKHFRHFSAYLIKTAHTV